MNDTDQKLANMRAVLLRKPEEMINEELTLLRAANDTLHHRVKVLECENRGLYAKLELLAESAKEAGLNPEVCSANCRSTDSFHF